MLVLEACDMQMQSDVTFTLNSKQFIVFKMFMNMSTFNRNEN